MRKTLFCTDRSKSGREFQTWRDFIRERFYAVEQRRLDDGRFGARIDVSSVGGLSVATVTQSAVENKRTAEAVRRDAASDAFTVLVKLRGVASVEQAASEAVLGPGDVSILDRNRPSLVRSSTGSSAILLGVPRDALENAVGIPENFAGRLLHHSQPTVQLLHTFVERLAGNLEDLDSASADRIAAISVDLIVAAVSERLGREPSHAIGGTLTVQRAKLYVRSNMSRTDLDPNLVAAAVGISTRRLQELFHERGHGVAEWIWKQRCASAAALLGDRGQAHLPISEVAYRCGFTSESHFSRRFRDAHGASPREFRRRVWQTAAED